MQTPACSLGSVADGVHASATVLQYAGDLTIPFLSLFFTPFPPSKNLSLAVQEMLMAKQFEYRDAERESADQYTESLNTMMMVAALVFDGVIMILIEGA